MTDSGAHFRTDEDLLSRYALGRLGAEESRRLDLHAAECPECKEALRREMLIAAGARKLGRGELKSRLNERIAVRRDAASWPRYAAAAAVFVLVAGIGVYYALMSPGETPGPLPVAAAPPAALSAPIARNEQDRPAEHAKANAPQKEKEAVRALSRDREDKRSEVSAVGGISRAQASDELSAAEPGGYWTEGVVTTPPEYYGQAASAPAAKVAPESGANALALKKAVREEAPVMKDAATRVREEYILRQKPSSALPAFRRKTEGTAGTVPAHVERSGSTTTMTLYLDSLVDDRELNGARVESPGGDSVVVTLGGRKIMYHLQPDRQGPQTPQK